MLLRVPNRRVWLVRRELVLGDGPVEHEAAHHPHHVQEPDEHVDNSRVGFPAQNLVINLQNSIEYCVVKFDSEAVYFSYWKYKPDL